MIDSIRKNMLRHGYVGDPKPAILAYLSLVSSLLDNPVSLLLKGASGAGKSFALKVAKRYVPKEAFTEFSGMSEKAILYMGDDLDLKHKSLIIQEAAGWGGKEGRAFLRQLLTEGEINYATVQSTEQGLVGGSLPPVEGPCGVIMTTTEVRFHEEDENRFLSFTVEETAEHTRAVLLAKARNSYSEPNKDELAPFHEHYRFLSDERLSVKIPFSEALVMKLPTNRLRVWRDFEKVQSLIQTVALLRCFEREQDENGAIIATLEDYEVARELLEDVLAQGWGIDTGPGVRAVVEAVQDLTKRGYPTTQRQIADHLGMDPGSVSRNVKQAKRDGLLIDENEGQGKRAQIRMGDEAVSSGAVLPEAHELGDVAFA